MTLTIEKFSQNYLINIYAGLYYSQKKTKRVANFFALLETVIENWQDFYEIFCKNPNSNIVVLMFVSYCIRTYGI